MDFNQHVVGLKNQIDTFIRDYLRDFQSTMSRPGLTELYSAIEYSLTSDGHRIRPMLAMLTAEALNSPVEKVLPLGLAIEMIHTYSLIHDDLPSMDNDDERRGKPANHKAFGEALAVLAGDALNTEAFFVLARGYNSKPKMALDLIMELALASGAQGMVGGQAADVVFKDRNILEPEIEFLHNYKTGALFKMSVLGAARLCDANAFQVKTLSDYARNFGLLFQIIDDIKDENNSDEPSYVKAVGMTKAKEMCDALVRNTEIALEPLGETSRGLEFLASQLRGRI